MLLVICSTVAALACRDIERPAETPGATKPVAQQVGPPVISSLTCTFTRDVATVSCRPAIPAAAAGVSASVIYGTGSPGSAQYGIFYAVNLIKNLTTQQWSFTAYVQNLLKQSIGTLNGTTVTGVKVFITDFHATAGSGTVSVANPDGVGTFTAPNQPYFNYNAIVAPSGYTGNKVWQFNVPNTVTAVSMSILISTDFPAEQSVSLAPPDTTAKWVEADTNTGGRTAPTAINVPYSKRTLQVVFTSTATLADRQLAVAAVNGTVVGGKRAADGISGWYVLQVPDDGTGAGVIAARAILKALPQVQSAFVMVHMSGAELTPNDGPNYSKWSLSPDSVSHSSAEYNWSLEAVDAPYAWGCSTGITQTKIGIVDFGFHTMPDLASNLSPSTAWVFALPGDTAQHGTATASILLAQGNNGGVGAPAVNMTGAMWRGSLFAVNVELGDSASNNIHNDVSMPRLGDGIVKLASLGVRAVNISVGLQWKDTNHQPRQPGLFAEDTAEARDAIGALMLGIRIAQTNYHVTALPLLVVAAGNFEQSGANGTTDAWWNVTPQLKDSLLNNVIVVGASTRSGTVANFSGANTSVHSLVDIMAPGDSIVFLSPIGAPSLARGAGTSYAAPLVTAAAGLLVSFDSTLGLPASGGAAELRGLILSGADSNTTPSGVRRMAGPYRLLSLYKPLVLAAKRKGAPLCRNRIWIANHAVVVRRSPTLVDTIYSSSLYPRNLVTYHAGVRVDFAEAQLDTSTSSTDSVSLYYVNGTWTRATLGPPSQYSWSGVTWSWWRGGTHSHSGDSISNWQKFGGGQSPSFAVAQMYVQDSGHLGPIRLLGSTTHPVYNVGPWAYSPRGDAVYAFTGKQYYLGFQTELWRFPIDGSAPTILAYYPWGTAENLAVSEDGSEVITEVATVIPPDTVGPPFNSASCYVEYRNSSTGARLDSIRLASATQPNGCMYNRMQSGSARHVAWTDPRDETPVLRP